MKKTKAKLTRFRPMILSRHPSHKPLRTSIQLNPFRSVVRFGSTTEKDDTIDKGGKRIEINTTQAIKNSANKLKMKQCFRESNIKTAMWWTIDTLKSAGFDKLPYPIISKSLFGSRGRGNTKINSREELERWMRNKTLSNYIFERFIPFKLEYRFHTNENGCFYVCRKALKADVPKEERWVMNDSTCVWYTSENEKFYKPNSYAAIEEECVKALQSLGLDFCAFDIRVQGGVDSKGNRRDFQDFFIVEGNSAPSLKEHGLAHYNREIPIILNKKWKNEKK